MVRSAPAASPPFRRFARLGRARPTIAGVHLQVLSSGSGGNSALVRAGAVRVLVDAGLTLAEMEVRLELAGVPPPVGETPTLDHVLVTHGHLDHARSAGGIARKHRAVVHGSEAMLQAPSLRRAKRQATLRVGAETLLDEPLGLRASNVALPHDAHPTVAFRLEHGGRVAVILTDMGRPDEYVARALRGAHVLVLEFNHDLAMLERGPYPAALKKRVGGDAGHLSNAQAAQMLRWLAGPDLHTLVLAHLSQHNNRPELALEAAHTTLEALGLSQVRVLVASQHEVGENLAV
jgi:phosphoribosyl 1,2-cyclic phosphodiesterase